MRKLAIFAAAAAMAAAMSFSAFAAKTDLTIAIDSDIDTLHPSDFSTTSEVAVLGQVYDTLMYMDPSGTKDPEPRIAESYEVSDDGLEYTFHLRDDVKFHDGSQLTSDDVKFSLEMYMSSEYQGSYVTGLTEVEAPDPQTVVCKLDSPYSPFLMGVLDCHIASKAYHDSVDEETFASTPMGCGPYKFVSRTSGSQIVLEAFDDYYRGAPAIKNVTFKVIPDSATTAIALQTGEINLSEIESSSLAQLESNPAITIARVKSTGFSYVAMNTEKEPFNSVDFRKAVNYALNRDNIVAVCYDGEAEVNSNLCEKSRFGYSDDQFQYTYDTEKAKECLEKAGITTPYDLGTILVAEKYSGLATVIQADLAAVGLNTTIAVEEFNTYIGDLTSGNFDISALEMTLDGDSQNLEMALTSEYIGTANNARYSDADMDKLFEETKSETDEAKRLDLFNQIFTKVQDEAIYAVLCNPEMLYAYSSDLNVPEFPLEGDYYVYDFSWNA